MPHPETSVLVLNYNGLEVTKKFLKDLYRNTENFQVVLIDNGSTDRSVEYLRDFAAANQNFHWVANPTNLGVINGRNFNYEVYAKQVDKPEYLVFLDNDQYVQPGWLQHHHDVMTQSKADLVGVEAWLMNNSFRPVKQCKDLGDPWTYVGCGGMLMKAEVPAKLGLFDPQFNPCYFEDPDFCFRVLDAGYKIAWNSKAKIIHLAHQTLGKRPDRMLHFQRSHAKFQAKWKGRRARPVRQFMVEALS